MRVGRISRTGLVSWQVPHYYVRCIISYVDILATLILTIYNKFLIYTDHKHLVYAFEILTIIVLQVECSNINRAPTTSSSSHVSRIKLGWQRSASDQPTVRGCWKSPAGHVRTTPRR